MICTKCGAKLKDDVKFCSECGAKLEEQVRICSSCGTILEDGAKFCAECGQPADKPVVLGGQKEIIPAEEPQGQAKISREKTSPSNMRKVVKVIRYCKVCGTKVPGGSYHCQVCGSSEIIEDEIEDMIEEKEPDSKLQNPYSDNGIKDLASYIKDYMKKPVSTIEELILSGNRKFSAFLFLLYVLISCAFYPLAASKICGELIGSYMEFLDESETVVQMIFCGLLGGVGTILFSSLLYFVTAKLQKASTGFLDAVIAAAGTSVIPALILLVGILLAFVLPTWSLAAFLLSQIFWWVLGMPAVLALSPNRDDPETDLANNGKLWLTYFAFLMISVIVGFILLFKIDSSIVDLESMLERSFEGLLGSLF